MAAPAESSQLDGLGCVDLRKASAAGSASIGKLNTVLEMKEDKLNLKPVK